MKTKRNTIQRTLILEAVEALPRHVTADEIYAKVSKEHPSISRGTVYRNLNQLAESGDIRKIEVTESADCFERRSPDHYHARCIKCGRLFDVDMPYMKDLEKEVKDTHGFVLTGHDIIFKGICPNCLSAAHTGAKRPVKIKSKEET